MMSAGRTTRILLGSVALLATYVLDIHFAEHVLITDHVDPLHLAVNDSEIERDLWLATLCPHETRQTIQEGRPRRLRTARESRRHVEGAVLALGRTDGDGGRVGDEFDVGTEQCEQRLEVAFP